MECYLATQKEGNLDICNNRVELEGITQSETRLTEIPKDMWNQRKREKKQNKTRRNVLIDAKEKHKQYLIGGHQR